MSDEEEPCPVEDDAHDSGGGEPSADSGGDSGAGGGGDSEAHDSAEGNDSKGGSSDSGGSSGSGDKSGDEKPGDESESSAKSGNGEADVDEADAGSSSSSSSGGFKFRKLNIFKKKKKKKPKLKGPDKWKKASDGEVPQGAVCAGQDKNGDILYIARAEKKGDICPGKLVPSLGACFVPWGGKEHTRPKYEVLINKGDHLYCWSPHAGGIMPRNAVMGGQTASGEFLFVGRQRIDGTLTCGKIHPSHHCLYLPYGGKEHAFREYEILIRGEIPEFGNLG